MKSFWLQYLSQICSYIKRPLNLFDNWAFNGRLNWMPDKWYLSLMFRSRIGYWMDWKHPKTFNEKLQWLKLYDRNPLYPTLVDKHAVKKWVADKIGKEYIIPTIGVWEKFDDINFGSLPKQFVLKCTHDSGSAIICKNKKIDMAETKKKIEASLNTDYYLEGREWPYKNVRRRIIAEKYMEDDKIKDLRDYKFFCFNGKVRCYKIDFNRFTSHKANYYDKNSLLIDVGERICPPDHNILLKQPTKLSEMIKLAQKLSCSIPFVRVDFYEVNGKVFFGEMTLYPAAGFGSFYYNGNDEMLGEWIHL